MKKIATWAAIIKSRPKLFYPADLYLVFSCKLISSFQDIFDHFMRDFRPRKVFLWLRKLKFSENFEEISYILEKIYKFFWKMQHKRPRLGPVRFSKICNLSVQQVQFCNLTARNLSVHAVYLRFATHIQFRRLPGT